MDKLLKQNIERIEIKDEALQILIDNNLDVVIGGFKEIYNQDIMKIRTANKEKIIYNESNLVYFMDKLISSKNSQENIEIGNSPVGRIYGRIFKREVLKNMKFNPEVQMSEDTLFMIELSYNLHKIGIVNNVWYNYYKNDYSITHNVNREKIMPFLKIFIKKKEKEENEILANAYKYRLLKTINNHREVLDVIYVEELMKKYIGNTKFNYLDEK